MRCLKRDLGIRRSCQLRLSIAALVFCTTLWAPSPSLAETRRAFLVGIQRYSDGNIQQLSRTVNDAKDLARDLEESGFDKKNIKVATDLKTKHAFDKEFNAFLKTVGTGDSFLLFLSGHVF